MRESYSGRDRCRAKWRARSWHAWNVTFCRPPLSDFELRQIFNRIADREARGSISKELCDEKRHGRRCRRTPCGKRGTSARTRTDRQGNAKPRYRTCPISVRLDFADEFAGNSAISRREQVVPMERQAVGRGNARLLSMIAPSGLSRRRTTRRLPSVRRPRDP
ncbi:hypothetical protein F2981_12145 [Sinorhizobium meliloti]|nr:hypothetical protein [Sinorhizobium meliloti]